MDDQDIYNTDLAIDSSEIKIKKCYTSPKLNIIGDAKQITCSELPGPGVDCESSQSDLCGDESGF